MHKKLAYKIANLKASQIRSLYNNDIALVMTVSCYSALQIVALSPMLTTFVIYDNSNIGKR